jgi:hypothetical protein
MNQLGLVEKRRRNLRIVLFVIILGTLPLYCLGFLLWGTSPPPRNVRASTNPPVTAGFTIEASPTPNEVLPSLTPFTFPTQNVVLPPSPYFPPAVTRFLSPTPTFYIFPTVTAAPTLTIAPSDTPLPSDTPIPIPTDTPIPIPTDTPVPTDTTAPTVTDTPTETATPTDTVIPPGS